MPVKTSSGGFPLTTAPGQIGNIELVINPDLQNPISINFNGQQENLQIGTDMTITATPSQAVDNYQWYLNGIFLLGQTGQSITIGSSLAGGSYRLDVVVTKGNISSSGYVTFNIISIPKDGLVGEWLFNGNAKDTSGNENNGAVNGATLATDRFGYSNKAYNFDGVDDYLVMGNNLPVDNEMTVSVWVKPDFNTLSDSEYDHRWLVHSRIILRKSDYYDDTFNLGLYGNPDYWDPSVPPVIQAGVTDTAGNFPYLQPSLPGLGINQGNWCHIALTYKRNNQLILYINGIMVNKMSTSDYGIRSSAQPLVFGVWAEQWNECWKGLIDDARIYNRALSASEIQALYHEFGWAVN